MDVKVRPLYFFFCTAAVQVIGLGIGAILLSLEAKHALGISPWVMLGLVAVCGLSIATILKLPTAWRALNFLLIPCVVGYVSLALPSGLLLAALVICILIYLPVIWTGVPYYPTSTKMYQVVADSLAGKSEFKFIDLGCGFGGLLAYLSRQFPQARFEGVEIGPLPWLVCKLRFAINPRVSIRFKSLWDLDLGQYQVVYAFLAPGPMPKLWEKAKRELKAGSVFLTNTFEVGENAHQVLAAEDRRDCKLYRFNF